MSNRINVTINGSVAAAIVGALQENRITIPLRQTFETLGHYVGWNSGTQTITVNGFSREMTFRIGQTRYTVRDFAVGRAITQTLPFAPRTSGGRTILPMSAPLRAVGHTYSDSGDTIDIRTRIQNTTWMTEYTPIDTQPIDSINSPNVGARRMASIHPSESVFAYPSSEVTNGTNDRHGGRWIQVFHRDGRNAGWVRPRLLREVGDVFADVAFGSRGRLTSEQQQANAEYIYSFLRNRAWSKRAICGLLGNIHHESHFNPGVWEFENTNIGGYGILQWTPNRKFRDWAELTVNEANAMATNNPRRLMDLQLEFLVQTWRDEWFSTFVTTERSQHAPPPQLQGTPIRYYAPVRIGFQDYITRSSNTVEEMAFIFHAHYLRSADSLSTIENQRARLARVWYNHF